ncbi:hypothetical protein CYLTODRAFT_417872 [Cylindrobasidium torrendii FP15055 ss-10]|uniref:Uncharacterized protein n=1 Tax=Cylindrobasidium torrendii FP15055 ss-10 TaxID=1314674 RepID=A0A0D7BPW7_9AGAR|nr:hypothetical protein CYLTODRAFT_417872 [Cylindrobasidium torrendii FP15055 ss-10]
MFSLKTLLVSVVAAATAVSAQEAVRYGVVDVTPTELSAGSSFTVTYNSTLARWQPEAVDFLLQRTANGQPTGGYVSLQRNDYAPDQTILSADLQTPDLSKFGDGTNADWLLWAFITYPDSDSDLKLIGGSTSGQLTFA